MGIARETLEKLLYEEEGTTLDVKLLQYSISGDSDDGKVEFLKDLLAFANSWRRTDAYILTGVKEVKGGPHQVIGVSEHLEDAHLQQLVCSKTNQPLVFSYQATEHEGKKVGVIRIPRQERPVFLKKDFGKLKKNVVYVRRGSSTDEAAPDEIAKMGGTPATTGFTGTIQIGFSGVAFGKELILPVSGELDTYPQQATEEILHGFERRRRTRDRMKRNRHDGVLSERVRRVKKAVFEENAFELFEKNSQKVNITVLNDGDSYVEDASIRLTFPAQGLLVAGKIYPKPVPHGLLESTYAARHKIVAMDYPSVESTDSVTTVTESMGDLKHKIQVEAFQEPLRIFLLPELLGHTVEVECTLFARNLPEPLTKTLRIVCQEPMDVDTAPEDG